MRNTVMTIVLGAAMMASCVSNKKYQALEGRNSDLEMQLAAERSKTKECQDEQAKTMAKVSALEATNQAQSERIKELKSTNEALFSNTGELATLSKQAASNLERSLESIKEKDLQINTLRDAITKKDSVTLALVTSIKGALGNMNDEDIEVNVEKGVVYISISDKLLFASGSTTINTRAKEILGKIAKVMKNKPDIEFMVEGHTDDVPIKKPGIEDNWDLSVLRATAVVRVLQDDFNVAPHRMTAAGRSYYVPLEENDSASNRARNRRTRIVVLPKLDQFYNMVEEGMEEAKKNAAEGK